MEGVKLNPYPSLARSSPHPPLGSLPVLESHFHLLLAPPQGSRALYAFLFWQ